MTQSAGAPDKNSRKEEYKDVFTRTSFFEYCHEEFIKSLPSTEIKELPSFYMYSVGFVVHATTFGFFLYFFITSFSAAISEKFLALSGSSGHCNDVLSSPSATLLADYNGYWEGEALFSYSESLYNFQMNNWATNLSNYQYVMGVMLGENSLQVVGELAVNYNLASNLLTWMSYSGIVISENSEKQKFTMNGDPTVIFDRKHQRGSIGNYFGDCNAESSTTFNSGTSMMSITYNYAEFTNNPNCSGTVNLADMGYNPAFDGEYFSLSYDVRSLASAVAVNQQVQYPDNFWFIAGTEMNYTYEQDGTSYLYVMGQGFDDRYPGMEPVLCGGDPYNYTAAPPFCGFLINNKVFALPLFDSYGADDTVPSYCDCSDGTGQTPNCNIFNFLSGLLFFPPSAAANYNQENAIFQLLHSSLPYNVSKFAYNAMFAGANVGNTSLAPYFNSAEYRAQAYDWCAMAAGNCSILSINSVDTLNTAVNSYYYQLPNGSCSDSFYAPNFGRLVNNPPVNLTEPYFECRDTVQDALVAAAGISTGTTAMLVPFIILVAVNLVVFVNRRMGLFNYRLYTKEERDRLLDLLALQLLLSRDGKLDSQTEITEPTILHEIMTEMSANVVDNGDYVVLAASQSGVHGLKESLKFESGVISASDEMDTTSTPLHDQLSTVVGKREGTDKDESSTGTELTRWDIRAESRESSVTTKLNRAASVDDLEVGKRANGKSGRVKGNRGAVKDSGLLVTPGVVSEVSVSFTGAYSGAATLRVHILSDNMAVLTLPELSFTALSDDLVSITPQSKLADDLCPVDTIVQTIALEDSNGDVVVGLIKISADGMLELHGASRFVGQSNNKVRKFSTGHKYTINKLSVSYEK